MFAFRVGNEWSVTELIADDELVITQPVENKSFFWFRRPRPPLPSPWSIVPRNIGGARIFVAPHSDEYVRRLPLTVSLSDDDLLGDIDRQYGLLEHSRLRWEEVGDFLRPMPGRRLYRALLRPGVLAGR